MGDTSGDLTKQLAGDDLARFPRAFVPRGHPDRITLGLAAPFAGGVRAVGPDGDRVLVAPSSPWFTFAIIAGTGLVVGGIVLATGGTSTVPLAVAAGMTVMLLALAIGVVVWGGHERKKQLVIDGHRRTCDLIVGARIAASIPATAVRRTWIQVYEPSDESDHFNVLVDLGTRELWVAQVATEADAIAAATAIARCLDVPCEPAPVRKT